LQKNSELKNKIPLVFYFKISKTQNQGLLTKSNIAQHWHIYSSIGPLCFENFPTKKKGYGAT
jgi:hypothetical protein